MLKDSGALPGGEVSGGTNSKAVSTGAGVSATCAHIADAAGETAKTLAAACVSASNSACLQGAGAEWFWLCEWQGGAPCPDGRLQVCVRQSATHWVLAPNSASRNTTAARLLTAFLTSPVYPVQMGAG
jgi:hypothetical protein